MSNMTLKSRPLGVLLVMPSLLMLMWVFMSTALMTLWGFAHGVETSYMMPFILLSILQLTFLVFASYASIRYMRNRPFCQHKKLGIILIIAGILYFVYEALPIEHFDITGINPEGEARGLLAFAWGLILFLLGVGLVYCKEEQ
jgi:hypothetical protein